ncbi:hypothetical protein NBO_2g0048 [Nosema bombycis CQ1]|uniref:Uncharacterized protein n=1 Tax=Nosema bombycis (strain CQ1 / CVCC 102059) TaxID=578461 RepID=R0KXC9_NOSB1|nr:hypothetical protein NBO_2g0048 [Nosema bombycis CQ1]|eukprot:EOB15556.1 hypothetical protein NBO_2g0048 [Nosema bombycis CQ1]
MKQGMDSELKNDSKKDEELSGYAFDDEYTAENIPDESPYDENDAIISSEWISEYWYSIRNRKPAINVPQ